MTMCECQIRDAVRVQELTPQDKVKAIALKRARAAHWVQRQDSQPSDDSVGDHVPALFDNYGLTRISFIQTRDPMLIEWLAENASCYVTVNTVGYPIYMVLWPATCSCTPSAP